MKDVRNLKVNIGRFLKLRVAPFVVAGAIAAGGIGIGHRISEHNVAQEKGEAVGYTNVTPGFEFNIDGNDFAILDVGCYETPELLKALNAYNIDYCNKKDIPVGIVVSTKADTEGELFKDVLYVDEIIKKFDVNLPVYLNVDSIIKNNNLDNASKKNLIQIFLKRCESNHIYVGIYGSDASLTAVYNILGITEYDAFVVKDDDSDITYPGSYSYYKDGKKILKTNEDVHLGNIISEKDLNNGDRILPDATYVYHTGDDLNQIAMDNGLSVNDLLYYNNLKMIPSLYYNFSIVDLVTNKMLEDGTVLYIPTKVNSSVPLTDTGFTLAEEPLLGVDVSKFNTTTPDWDLAEQTLDFIIIRDGHGESKDDNLDSYVSNAMIRNIPIGLYHCFEIEANSTVAEAKIEAAKEAKAAIKYAEGVNVEYPIYLDIENGTMNELSDEALVAILQTWYEKISAAGYIPGFYTSSGQASKVREACNTYDSDLYDKLSKWYTHAYLYNSPRDYTEYGYQDYSDGYAEESDYDVQQVSSSAKNSPFPTDSGNVDVDYSKYDYSKPITDLSTSEITSNEELAKYYDISSNEVNGAILLGVGLIGIVIHKKKKAKQLKKSKKRK